MTPMRSARDAKGRPRPVEILLVEDSPSDRLLTATALEQADLLNNLHIVANGMEAMAFLRREGRHVEAPRPDLILLDLNMPRMDGREVLAQIKGDPRLRAIPVVVMTTSAAPDDVAEAYGAHANSFITKPTDFTAFHEAMRALGAYWFGVVTPPPDPADVRARAMPGAAIEAAPPRDGKLRVLLIEDSPTDALLLMQALEEAEPNGFEVTRAVRLGEARGPLGRERFDLILSDLQLPDSRGLDTVRELRGMTTGEPIVVLTGSDDPTIGQQALELGAEDYLLKAEITGTSLARAIRYAIHRRDAREQRHHGQRIETVGRLAAGVAHDFNNLLTAIQTGAELLSQETDPVERDTILAEVLEAARRGRGLTRQLLAFGRRDLFTPVPVDLNEVVTDVTSMLRRLTAQHVTIEHALAPQLPQARADRGMLEQVIINLGVNASDAMPAGGTLTLRTGSAVLTEERGAAMCPEARPGLFLTVAVHDTGPGIPAAVLHRIFEPFFTTKGGGRGTGLGLATVREIAMQHGGCVDVESSSETGTTFTLYLPVAQPGELRQPAPPAPPAPIARRPGEAGTILLTEDDPPVRSAIERMLVRQGFTVHAAEHAEAAIRLWHDRGGRRTFDLLFTDLVMPGELSGLDLARVLRAEAPDLPVIYASGYSAEFRDPQTELREGENFLPKPFDMAHLVELVNRVLGRRV